MFTFKSAEKIIPDEKAIGGKAYSLAQLSQSSFNVPKWFVVTTEAFQKTTTDFLASNDPEKYFKGLSKINIPGLIKTEIEKSIHEQGLKDKLLAVRSSAVGEDSAEYSFAGQLDSYLYVTYQDLFEMIKKVWASAFSKTALAYREQNNLDIKAINVAVVVQEMIDSEVSGVSFGLDPVSGDRKAVTISAVYGLGEGLVSGLLDSDNFLVKDSEIISDIADKNKAICFNDELGKHTKEIDLSKELQQTPCLNEKQILEIAVKTKEISAFFGKPQDIEWGIVKDELFILQSRPITTLGKTPDLSQQKVIWDNSNIIESYSGVTTPLTFSFIRDVYTQVYIQFCRIMGVEDELIEKNKKSFSMIGLIEGRVYYNLLNWYKLIMMLPGYSINAGFMEQMMGVQEKLETPPTIIKSSRNEYLRTATLVYMLIRNLFKLPQGMKKFYNLLASIISPFKEKNLKEESPEQLMRHYYYLEETLLKKWDAPLINDFYAMIFYGLLKKIINKWGIDSSDTLQNDLLCGEGDMISTEPVRYIRSIANSICESKETENLFNNEDVKTIQLKLESYPEIKTQITGYIEKFGDRWFGELKLESITPKQDPILLIQLLKTHVKQGFVDLEESKQNEQKLRKAAEIKVRRHFKNKVIKKILFKKILTQARNKVKNRENLRFERTRVFSLVREIFLAMGNHFYSESIIENPRDIFYMSKEEIFSFIDGTSVSLKLTDLIKSRKREFTGYQDKSPADRFITYGMIYHANTYQTSVISDDAADDGLLKGIGCCPGIVKAPIRYIEDPNDVTDLEGCILVAERTDPGWAPLFPIAKGILIERGSLLSHSAIVAREMGIPMIVGINSLTKYIVEGELIEMNGAEGSIKFFRDN